jgi:hypothetical protein
MSSSHQASPLPHPTPPPAGGSVNLATAVPTSVRTMTGTIKCPNRTRDICNTQPEVIGQCNNGYLSLPDGYCTCKLQYVGDQWVALLYLLPGAPCVWGMLLCVCTAAHCK